MDRKKVLAGAAAVALLTLGAGGVAYADDEISGADADKAKEAALAHTGGGRVTDTETGDEGGYYEVEVTRNDGTETDVHLDRDFDVVSSDDDGPDDDGPDDDDGFDD